MLDATEDGESDEMSSPRWGFPQFGIRDWYPVNRLQWARPVVISDELTDDTTEVIGTREDEVVECIVPQCPHESLDKG